MKIYNNLTERIVLASLLFSSFINIVEAQNIGINSTGASPNSSAALDIDMNNKGLLIPRVALTGTGDNTTISSAATSLLIYNTATAGSSPTNVVPGYYWWNGSSWIPLGTNNTAASLAWSTTGNTGTTAGTNFIGTTDAVDWIVKTTNTQALRVSSSGNVGISSSGSPSRRLYLAGGAVTSALGGAFWIDSDNTASASDAGQILLNANGSASDESRIIMRNETRGVYASIEGVPTAVSDGGLNFVSRNAGTYVNAMSIINTGNVGIGTTSPTNRLHVNNSGYVSAMIQSSSGQADLVINKGSTSTFSGVSSMTNSSLRWFFGSDDTNESGSNAGSDYNIRGFSDAGAFLGTYFFIKRSSGNVGIGTTSPSQRLDVASVGLPTTATSRLANIEAYNAGDALLWGHTNTLASASLGSKSGNGAAYLQFFAYHSNNSNNARYTGNPYGGGDIAYPGRVLSDDGTSNNVFSFESGDAPGQDNEITWTKRMVINQNGNVGIGTTSPGGAIDANDANGRLVLSGGATFAIRNTSNVLTIRNTDNSSGSDLSQIVLERGNGSGTDATITTNGDGSNGVQYIGVAYGANVRMSIHSGGNVGIGTTAPTQLFHVFNGSTNGTYTTTGWAHSSDRRLKTNISTIKNSLDKVLQLQGVYYNWKTEPNKNRQIGFIAQDIEPILPEIVIKDSEGNYSLSYGNLTSVLVNAMKEQQEIINAQAKRIEALEADKNEWQKIKAELFEVKAILEQQTKK